ncbi:putative gas vesicle synthesis protein [Streptomyces ambofaciens ATCC 23877]|uniref:Putative gas vesicle synthesis protein n=1 Tax=Streptomyces ambofaciens (strain ATCC 23877 / 3486 / DSM 40053 / JCM 4204 / NBRC 12836 / NRRL B-2516) TaxID=278992 RepID=A0AD42_STRA7|nr:GvpL/GvpF family gas vesicle protein [Streptomyces ambofaciens]AKZ59937.1 putative gas vesicle synthesis protein [Streptomyces ambofaciens ATCC 23877]CAJ88397.1 putative gas vesicle synthesis protein [Streptomyces ambofaciens ATCC 23877]
MTAPTTSAPDTTAPTTGADATTADATATATALKALYVYGITPAGVSTPRSPGVDGAPVRLLTESGLCAAVSSAPARLRPRRRDLMAHQAVLDELAAQGPLLPMRFAVLSPRPDALASQLRADADHLKRQLEDVRGCVELNVKGTVVPGHFADLVRRDEGLRALALRTRRRPDYEGNVRLGEALARGVRREARRAAGDVLDRLTPLAVRTVRGPTDDEQVLSASFLLRSADERRFRQAVDELARACGDRLAISLTGPLPCYSFVDPSPERSGR